MYSEHDQPARPASVRLGILYPDHAAEDDYARAGGHLAGVECAVVSTSIGEDAHREDALRDTGDLRRILAVADRLIGVDAAMWACTSGSFVFGLDGARAQAARIEEALGVPASSTSLAFVAALEHLSIRRVAVAATYPEDVTAMFVGLLAAAGVESVASRSLDILRGADVGRLEHDDVVRLVEAHATPGAEAVLVPDTALHTIAWIEELERVAGRPVLTANQVTIWEGLRLAGARVTSSALGSLFAAPAQAPGRTR